MCSHITTYEKDPPIQWLQYANTFSLTLIRISRNCNLRTPHNNDMEMEPKKHSLNTYTENNNQSILCDRGKVRS